MKLFPSSSSSRCGGNSCWSLVRKMVSFFVTSTLLLSSSSTTITRVDASAAAAASTAAVGGALKQAFSNIDYRYFIAGGTCAAISHGITTPIDVVKTRIQAKPRVYNKGMMNSALTIIKEEGPHTLLQGLGPTIVGYGIEGSMKFGCYEIGKVIFGNLLAKSSSETGAVAADIPPLAFLLASISAGAVAAILLCPLESLRIKQVTDKQYSQTNVLTGSMKLIKDDGIFSLFSGLFAMLSKQVPYTFGKQVSFDIFAKSLYGVFGNLKDTYDSSDIISLITTPEILKWIVSILSAAMASIVACLLSQPGDMILTETYKTPTKSTTTPTRKRGSKGQTTTANTNSNSFLNVIRTIYSRDGGINEFFVGTNARIVHVGVIITSQLVIYDIVKQLLGLPATGSH